MKNLSYVINGVLAVAIIILFILFFTSKNSPAGSTSVKFESDTTLTLPIAYVNVDSIWTNYEFAKNAREILLRKSESSNATLNAKRKQIESEQAEFNRKLQNNAFFPQERAEQEMQRIQKMGADFQQLAGRLEEELAQEQMKMNSQFADSVRTCVLEYNKTANYHIILTNSGYDNVLYAKEKYNITDKVIDLLNKRHAATPKQ